MYELINDIFDVKSKKECDVKNNSQRLLKKPRKNSNFVNISSVRPHHSATDSTLLSLYEKTCLKLIYLFEYHA